MNLAKTFSSTRVSRHLSRLLARATLCGVLLVLPACAMPQLRQAPPAPPLPESFNVPASSDTNSGCLTIEEFFNDPNLTALIEQAVANNRELQFLNEEIQVARAEVLARRGAYLPFVGFEGAGGIVKHSFLTPLGAAEEQLEYRPGKNFANPSPYLGGGLPIFWQLDVWRELRNARDASIQRYLAAKERRNFFVTRLVAENAENYFSLMAFDRRIENLDQTIQLQEESMKTAQRFFDAGRGTELAIQRFLAEVRKNQSEKLIVQQDIIQFENKINLAVFRTPQPVERSATGFYNLTFQPLATGVPSQLLLNRPDIRQAERELEAAGLDILVARAHFFPKVSITGNVGYEAFNPRYLLTADGLFYNATGNLVGPIINKKAIQAEYMSANAKQLEAVYNYQQTVLNAFTQVVNRMTMVDNYTKSLAIKNQQLDALKASVDAATRLFNNARVEYVEVLLAQRDLRDARNVLIETKKEQLAAIVKTYQALGGGSYLGAAIPEPPDLTIHGPYEFRWPWHLKSNN